MRWSQGLSRSSFLRQWHSFVSSFFCWCQDFTNTRSSLVGARRSCVLGQVAWSGGKHLVSSLGRKKILLKVCYKSALASGPNTVRLLCPKSPSEVSLWKQLPGFWVALPKPDSCKLCLLRSFPTWAVATSCFSPHTLHRGKEVKPHRRQEMPSINLHEVWKELLWVHY